MLFVRLCLDKAGFAEMRGTHRDAHRAFLASRAAEVAQAGPLLDEDGIMLGSMTILDVPSLDDVRRFHDGDPFTKAGLFDHVVLRRWDRHTGGGAPGG